MPGAKKPTPLLVVYQNLPHYRYDVFKVLEWQARDVVFLADPSDTASGILQIPPGNLRNFKRLRNYWIGPCLWQNGVLGAIISERPCAVIFTGDPHFLSTWTAATICRLLRIPVLFWTIGWHRPEAGLKRAIRLTFLRLADRLLLYGDTGARIGISLGYPRHRMKIIKNSSSRPFEEAQNNPRLQEISTLTHRCKILLGAVIRLNKNKRLGTIVDCAAELRAEGRPVGVLLVGDGDDVEGIKEHARRLHVPLCLPGPAYSEEDLQTVYEALDVTVLPTLAGLTTIQSLRHGVPVVTHDNPYEQVPESDAVINNLTGARFSYGSGEDLVRAVKQAIALTDIPTTAESCRYEVATNWSAESHAAKIISAVDEVIEARAHRSRRRRTAMTNRADE